MKYKVCTILIILLLVIALPASGSNLIEVCSVTIHPAQNTSCENYKIVNPQFSHPVKAHVYNGALILDTTVLPSVMVKINSHPIYLSLDNPEQELDDYTHVSASDFTMGNSMQWEYSQYNPAATIHITARERPALSVEILPEYSSYRVRQNANIRWKVVIKNTGHVDITDIDIIFVDKPTIHYDSLYLPIEIAFSTEIPYPANLSKYDLNVMVSYKSVLITNKEDFTAYANASVKLEEPESISSKQWIYLYKTIPSRVYTENTSVTLSLVNLAPYPITDVRISDKFKDLGIVHTWSFPVLKPDSSWTYIYLVKPSQPGSFVSPSAIATFYVNGTLINISSISAPVTVISMGNKVSMSEDEYYSSPIVTIHAPAQTLISPGRTSQPIVTQPQQQHQITDTPVYAIPGFEIIYSALILMALIFFYRINNK